MGPEYAVEPLHGDGEDGGAGAGERDLGQRQQPGNQTGVNLRMRNNKSEITVTMMCFTASQHLFTADEKQKITNFTSARIVLLIMIAVCRSIYIYRYILTRIPNLSIRPKSQRLILLMTGKNGRNTKFLQNHPGEKLKVVKSPP